MPLSPSETKALLERLGHAPRKSLGQNFLIDGNIVRKSIDLSGIGPGSAVVEIGPGLGTLSRAILETGSSLWAVEHDPKLAGFLRDSLLTENSDFHLVEGDCLDHPLADLPTDEAAGPFQIVANLPYAVSTPWMEQVLSGPLPERMVLMLQKEAGDRFAAEPGGKHFGAISIFLQSAFELTGRHLVSARCFYPAPKVSSVLLRFQRKTDATVIDPSARKLIRKIFTQRRKQLGALCRNEGNTGLMEWFDFIVREGVPETARPEQIPVAQWLELSKFCNHK